MLPTATNRVVKQNFQLLVFNGLFANFLGVPLACKTYKEGFRLPQPLATFREAGSKWSNGSEVMVDFLTSRFYANFSRFLAHKDLILIEMAQKIRLRENLDRVDHQTRFRIVMLRVNFSKFEYSSFS